MALSIKNRETEELARKVAALAEESLTETIRISLQERHERLVRRRRPLHDELKEIADRIAALPDISEMTEDEILGYDEFGAPTR